MDYGFYGIFGLHDDPAAALALASEAIAKETDCTAECIKTFLESCKGRLFALAVIEELKRLFAEGVIEELKSTNALKPAFAGAIADGGVVRSRRTKAIITAFRPAFRT